MFPLKDGEKVRLKLLRMRDVLALCYMMFSLSSRTRRFFDNPLFNVRGLLSFLKTYILLTALLLINKLFGYRFLCVIAINKQGEVVGHAHIRVPLRYFFRCGLKRVRYGIVIRDDYQGRGLGTLLTHAIIEMAREAGVEAIDLFVRVENHRAINLYRKFGFVTVSNVRRGKKGEMYYHMVLNLGLENFIKRSY